MYEIALVIEMHNSFMPEYIGRQDTTTANLLHFVFAQVSLPVKRQTRRFTSDPPSAND